MAHFEYKVVPAPTRGDKVRGVKQPEARFANSVEAVLNRMAEGGWEYVRAEMLPSEERSGISKTTREWRNLLIFRRERVAPGTMHADQVATPEAPAHPAVPVTPPAVTADPVAPAATVAAPAAVARDAKVSEPGFAEAPAAFDGAHGAEDTAERPEGGTAERPKGDFAERPKGDGPIPLRPLRGSRDGS